MKKTGNTWGPYYQGGTFGFQNLIDTVGCNVIAFNGTNALQYGVEEDFKEAFISFLKETNKEDWGQVLIMQFGRTGYQSRKMSNIKACLADVCRMLSANVIWEGDLPGGHGNPDTYFVILNIQTFKDGVADGSISIT
jgi:hypothetical protein